MIFNIIATFGKFAWGISQEIFDVDLNSPETDENFLELIFEYFDNKQLTELTKLSVCAIGTYEECPKFLLIRNGKYYFDTDKNKDKDTATNFKIKEKYLKNIEWGG